MSYGKSREKIKWSSQTLAARILIQQQPNGIEPPLSESPFTKTTPTNLFDYISISYSS